jgi:hypothetical protein
MPPVSWQKPREWRALAGTSVRCSTLDRTSSAARLQAARIRVVRHKFVAAMSNKMISRALSKFAQRSALLAPRSTAIPHLRFENRMLDCF